jgi:REP element-mobilizing transposase RayT
MTRARGKTRGRDNEPPMPDALAYFLTWTCYGTWLPGDERGWVKYRRGMQLPDPSLMAKATARLAEPICLLDHQQRTVVEETIRDHCRIREWALYAVNCRSNHVHVVVGANAHPKTIREQFKAWSTRRLKELEHDRRKGAGDSRPLEGIRKNWWAERGSGLYVNDEEGLEDIVFYVREAQDRPR